MGLLQYRGEFADSFDANDASDLLGFEARCAAQDQHIFALGIRPRRRVATPTNAAATRAHLRRGRRGGYC